MKRTSSIGTISLLLLPACLTPSASLMEVARRSPHLQQRPMLLVFEEEIRLQEQEEALQQIDEDDVFGEEDSDSQEQEDDSAFREADEQAEFEALEAELKESEKVKRSNAKAKKTRRPRLKSEQQDAVNEVVQKVSPNLPVEDLGRGKFNIGGNAVHVRLFKTHVVCRVGGGWQPLYDFLVDHPRYCSDLGCPLTPCCSVKEMFAESFETAAPLDEVEPQLRALYKEDEVGGCLSHRACSLQG